MTDMIKFIIPALYSYYSKNEKIATDSLLWLANYVPEDEKNIINEWFELHDICNICGSSLLTTYVTDRSVNPPVKKPFKFCPKCYV